MVVIPLVSIVIPTYNHARFLGRALKSIIDQTYTNWEAIVVDNHSTDNTDEIVNSFSDSRIHYIKIHNNGVIAVSRNVGIQNAKGEWIAFLDSDDYWHFNKLEICMKSVDEKVDLLYHCLIIQRKNKNIFQKKYIKSRQVKTPVLMDLLIKGNAIATSSVVVRKFLLQKIGGMNESREMIAAEDYNSWLRIAEYTDKFLYLPDVLGNYLVHNQGLSQKDMSTPTRSAVSGFLYLLNDRQKKHVESTLMFIRSKYLFQVEHKMISNQDLLYYLNYGPFLVKIKSIYLYFIGYVSHKK